MNVDFRISCMIGGKPDMTRYFNTEGVCRLEEHYMVRLDERLNKIKRLYVDRGKYFVINRGRQYGKTTTLRALEEYLKDDYLVVSMDFQGIGAEEFVNTEMFVLAFAEEFLIAFVEEISRVIKTINGIFGRSYE